MKNWLVVLYLYYLKEENTVTSDSCTGYHECSFYSLVFYNMYTEYCHRENVCIFHLLYGQPSSLCFSSHKRDHFTKVIP